MDKSNKPIVAITMGDAAGIGPEIIVKALNKPDVYELCSPFVVGDIKMLERAERIVQTGQNFKKIDCIGEAAFHRGIVECFDLNLLSKELPFGQISADAGHAAYKYVEKAVQLAMEKEIHSICTAPLNKEALHLGGHFYLGHTEILAELSGTKNFAMMFSSPELKVILVTIHEGLIAAVQNISKEKVFGTIKLAQEALMRAGVSNPRIGVCGINPHAGESGLFGNGEEEEKIIPAIALARENGILASGPLPADSAFYLARRGDYDIVVAMYHDQGLGPIKVLGLEHSVNITVGLPFVRTSVDHGTAFNIAGTGIADETNMVEAIRQAAILTSLS